MIADMEANKKIRPIINELSLKGKKLNISFVFIPQSYFKVPKLIMLNTPRSFNMKTPNIIKSFF